MTLSIIIASLNDQDETHETIKSIRDTAGKEPEIVLVDDCSGAPMRGDWRFENDPNLKLISNRWRCGCGPSRHIGALHASGDWLLITDSHMRFRQGWYQEAKRRLWQCPASRDGWEGCKALYCATCVGLDRMHMDVNQPVAEYNGATFNFHGPDRHAKDKMQTLECVWIRDGELSQEDDAEIPAIMGAGYFIARDWFLYLSPTRFLRTWGQDELFLSLKTWLAGGEVRLMKSVQIGHRFPYRSERKMFNLPLGHVQFNKVMAAHAFFPEAYAEKLSQWVLTPENKDHSREVQAATALVRQDWHIIAQEKAHCISLFEHNIAWLCDKFGLTLP